MVATVNEDFSVNECWGLTTSYMSSPSPSSNGMCIPSAILFMFIQSRFNVSHSFPQVTNCSIILFNNFPQSCNFFLKWLVQFREFLFFVKYLIIRVLQCFKLKFDVTSCYYKKFQQLNPHLEPGSRLYRCPAGLNPLRKTDALTTLHYNNVIMGAMAFRITSLTIVYSTVYSDADQRKHQSSASLAFVRGIHRGPVNSLHKWSVTRKMFPFDDVIMNNIQMQRFQVLHCLVAHLLKMHGALAADQLFSVHLDHGHWQPGWRSHWPEWKFQCPCSGFPGQVMLEFLFISVHCPSRGTGNELHG